MNFLGMVNPGIIPADALMGLAFWIVKILAFGALGIVLVEVVMSCLCDFFECRKWRQCHGRTEIWRLMH